MSCRPTVVAMAVAAVPVALAAAAVALKTGRWSLYVDRHRIELTPKPGRTCPHCYGNGGWWIDGPDPEMEACGCWADRRELRIRLLPIPASQAEPPF